MSSGESIEVSMARCQTPAPMCGNSASQARSLILRMMCKSTSSSPVAPRV